MPQTAPRFNTASKTRLKWALEIAERGLPVFPLHWTLPNGECTCSAGADCTSKGKHPIYDGGYEDATTDEAKIRAWWKAKPDANIGIHPGDKFAYIDLDVTKGKNGPASLAKYLGVSINDLLKMTYTVQTASGGWHLYFSVDAAQSNRAHVLPGVDVRGQGGHVVAEGSTIYRQDEFEEWYEAPYKVINDVPVAPIPIGISGLLREQMQRAENAHISLHEDDIDSDSAISLARQWLKNRKPAVAYSGGNQHTYVTAAQLRDRNISEAMCFQLLNEEGGWNERCEPPWDYEKLKGIVKNAYNYAKQPMGNVVELFKLDDDEASELPPDFCKPVVIADDDEAEQLRFIPDTHAQMLAKPKPEYLFAGLFEVGTVAVIYGLSRSYKTFTTMAMLLAAAAGHHEWCGVKIATKRLGRKLNVIYVIGEGGRSFINARMAAWLKKHKLTLEDVNFWTLTGNMPNLLAGKDFDNFLKSIQSPLSPCRDPDVIVIDTLSRAIAGQDEDKSQNISQLLDNVEKKLQKQFPRVLTLFVAHTGKDPSKGIRGSYAMLAGIDASIYAERVKSPALSSVWEVEKVKDGRDEWSMTIDSTMEKIDMPDIDGNVSPVDVPVFDVRGADGKTGNSAIPHYTETFTLTDVEIVRLVLDVEKAGTRLSLAMVRDAADKLITLPGPVETRKGNFEKRLRERLTDDTGPAKKFRAGLKGLVRWDKGTGSAAITLLGQGGKLGAWEAFNRANSSRGGNLMELAEAETPPSDDSEI